MPDRHVIEYIRESRGLTMAECEALIYVPAGTWADYEAGVKSMHQGLWELFCLKTEGKLRKPDIDRGHHLPPRKRGDSKYPWADMQPGDSVLIEGVGSIQKIRSSLTNYQRRGGCHFRTAMETDKNGKMLGLRVYRVE